MLVDLARSDVLVTGEGDVEVAFVVSEVQVDFTTVVENVDLAVSYSSVSFILFVLSTQSSSYSRSWIREQGTNSIGLEICIYQRPAQQA